jgi:hypothetical protein
MPLTVVPKPIVIKPKGGTGSTTDTGQGGEVEEGGNPPDRDEHPKETKLKPAIGQTSKKGGAGQGDGNPKEPEADDHHAAETTETNGEGKESTTTKTNTGLNVIGKRPVPKITDPSGNANAKEVNPLRTISTVQSLTARKEEEEETIVNLANVNVENITALKTISEIKRIFQLRKAAATSANALKTEEDPDKGWNLDEKPDVADEDGAQESLASYLEPNRQNHIRRPSLNFTPAEMTTMQTDGANIVKEMHKRLTKRQGVFINNTERQQNIAVAAEWMARARWPDYVLTSVKVLASTGGAVCCLLTNGGVLAIPIVATSVKVATVASTLSAVKSGVEIAASVKKEYEGWDVLKRDDGLLELSKLGGDSNMNAENLKEYKVFVRIAAERRLRFASVLADIQATG